VMPSSRRTLSGSSEAGLPWATTRSGLRCGTPGWVKDRREVDLVDLPAFDQCVVLRVVRTRWRCPKFRCGVGSWSLEHLGIAPAGHRLTTRAGRWVCEQVGRYARTVSEVADPLGCDWHTVNDAVVAYGEASHRGPARSRGRSR
jgi:hypothetical protein